MERESVVAILNALLAAEQGALPSRLLESTIYVSRGGEEPLQLVRKLAACDAEHAAQLANAVMRYGGSVGMRQFDVRSADLHFQDLGRVLPRLVSDRVSLIETYTLAAQRLGTEPEAGALVSTILASHREALSALEAPCDRDLQAAR